MTHRERARILLICGSLNQTAMMHAIGRELSEHDCAYTPYYCDGLLRGASLLGWLDFTIIGDRGPQRALADAYMRDCKLPLDVRGARGGYDLIVTCSDLIIQKNIRRRPIVLVQEGMTDPESLAYLLVRSLKLPRWLASTSTTGLSAAYERFCVASPGYRDLFVRKGVPASKIVVTGLPNFDNCGRYLANDFPFRGYVLVATSDTRETFKRDNRARLFERVRAIAAGRPIIVKLHPNENVERSTAEVRAYCPDALVFAHGDVNHMIANCDVLVTQYSTVVYVGLALGKECHSYFDHAHLTNLLPIQNGGTSAANIARVCEELLSRGAREPEIRRAS